MSPDEFERKSGPRAIPMIIAGCAVMLFAAFVSLVGTGAGHGWMRPILVTLWLFAIWPIAFWLPTRAPGGNPPLEKLLAVIITLAAIYPVQDLLSGYFYSNDLNPVEISLPWPGIAFLLIALAGSLAFLWHRKHYLALLPALLLGIGMFINLGLFWQANYGPGPWRYNGSLPDVLWFGLWATWQFVAVWGLLRAFDPPSGDLDNFA